MVLRQLSSLTRSSCSYLVLSTNRSMFTKQYRHLATSAQKRKWLREEGNKSFVKKKHDALAAEEAGTTKQKSTKNNWQPLFFLGVFPVFMSVVVVLSRDDLREEVNTKGIGRFLEDYKRWRRKSHATSASIEQQQEEEETEYDKMLNHLEQQKSEISSSDRR